MLADPAAPAVLLNREAVLVMPATHAALAVLSILKAARVALALATLLGLAATVLGRAFPNQVAALSAVIVVSVTPSDPSADKAAYLAVPLTRPRLAASLSQAAATLAEDCLFVSLISASRSTDGTTGACWSRTWRASRALSSASRT